MQGCTFSDRENSANRCSFQLEDESKVTGRKKLVNKEINILHLFMKIEAKTISYHVLN